MPHVIQIINSGVQSNDQEYKMPQFCTQDSIENINFGEEVAYALVVNTPKYKF